MSASLMFKNLVFPIFCMQCGVRLLTEENRYFCPTCWDLSPRIERPFCTVCGQPQQGRVGFGSISNFPCQDCRGKDGCDYDRLYAAAHYEGAIAEAIKLLKFYAKLPLQESLGELMVDFAREQVQMDRYDCVVPVPLHKVRLRDRGFNQAELLAHRLVEAFPELRLESGLKRIRPTLTQSQLATPKERRENVRGAFAFVRERSLEGQRVLLVDDVSTSGRTGAECATALRRAGALGVEMFVIAIPVKGENRAAGVL